MAGITPSGFEIRTQQDLRAIVAAKLASRWNTSVQVLNELSAVGLLTNVFTAALAEAWEVLQAVYNSQNPDAATGDALRSLRLLTGTLPIVATGSSATLSLAGTSGTTIPALSRAENAEGVLFETQADATLALVAARAPSTSYTGSVIARSNAGNVYVSLAPGTTGAGGGPTGTGIAIVDGTINWTYVGPGNAFAQVNAIATTTGPIESLAYSISTITTPVSGWNGVRNLLDATLGNAEETDESFRVRGEAELSGAGSHTKDAMRADILRQFRNQVTSCQILQNKLDYVVDGMPAHSVECLIRGGDGQEIAEYLFSNVVGLGYSTHGNESYNVTDSRGLTEVVKFSRPVEIPIYVTVTLTKDPITYPADGDLQVKQAIVAWGDSLPNGWDIAAVATAAAAFRVPGVFNVSDLDLGTAPSPSGSGTIAVAIREIATFDTSRIVVTSSDVSP